MIERALAGRPALLDVMVTPEAVSSDAKSGLAWAPHPQALATWDDAERAWRAQGVNGSRPGDDERQSLCLLYASDLEPAFPVADGL